MPTRANPRKKEKTENGRACKPFEQEELLAKTHRVLDGPTSARMEAEANGGVTEEQRKDRILSSVAERLGRRVREGTNQQSGWIGVTALKGAEPEEYIRTPTDAKSFGQTLSTGLCLQYRWLKCSKECVRPSVI